MASIKHNEQIVLPAQGMKWGADMGTFCEAEGLTRTANGVFFMEMRDAKSGELLDAWTSPKKNILTLDCGILAARLFRNSLEPNAGTSNGVRMLAIGTGAVGNLLAPNAPQPEQRKLNSEICRKAFSSAQFRNANGVAVAYPTNIVDFTATFGEAEAVGPLNEMGVMAVKSLTDGPNVNKIDNGPGTGTPTYDPTIDVSAKDLLANYLTFACISKPSTAILTFTWRFSF